jgi:hypothetical protein
MAATGDAWGRGMDLGCRATRLPRSASCSSLSYCNPFNITPIQPRLTKSNLFLFFPDDVLPKLKVTAKIETYRAGLRHAFIPSFIILGSIM